MSGSVSVAASAKGGVVSVVLVDCCGVMTTGGGDSLTTKPFSMACALAGMLVSAAPPVTGKPVPPAPTTPDTQTWLLLSVATPDARSLPLSSAEPNTDEKTRCEPELSGASSMT